MLVRKIIFSIVLVVLTPALTPVSALAGCGPVIIDAGHGGWDSGAVGPTGFSEKAANLDIARRIRDLLTRAGYTVIMTRDSDISPNSPPKDLTGNGAINVGDDLQARVNIANRAAGRLFVSIHNNAALSRQARGTETYYWSGSSPDSSSARLATLIQQEVVGQVGLWNRGVLGANFYVLRRTDMPAALVEGAFISNPTEELLLKTPSFRQKLAEGVYNGIRRYTGPAPKNEPTILRRAIKAGTRLEINVNDYVCDKPVGARVTADVPITAERSLYVNSGGRSGVSATRGSPKAGRTWYLAEGSTYPGFETWLLLMNPSQYSTTAQIKYMTETDSRDGDKVVLPPFSRRSVYVNPALPNRSFGVKVTAGRPIVTERSVFFNYGGRTGTHSSIGVISPAKQWYFAAGSTAGDKETWLCLLNPGPDPAQVSMTYVTPAGEISGGKVTIPPYRRRSVGVGGVVPDSEMGAIITANRGIVAERVQYFNEEGVDGGSASIGTRRPSKLWYFAEGDTRGGRKQFLALLNPATVDASVSVEYLLAKGITVRRHRTVPARSQLTLYVNDPAQIGSRKQVAVRLISDTAIVADRTMYLDFLGYRGSHSSIGSLWMSKRWYFAEGFTGGGFETRLIVSNPTKFDAKVKVRFIK